jgi:hypothetical protein
VSKFDHDIAHHHKKKNVVVTFFHSFHFVLSFYLGPLPLCARLLHTAAPTPLEANDNPRRVKRRLEVALMHDDNARCSALLRCLLRACCATDHTFMYPERRSLSRRVQPASRGFCSPSPSLRSVKNLLLPLVQQRELTPSRMDPPLSLFESLPPFSTSTFVPATRACAPLHPPALSTICDNALFSDTQTGIRGKRRYSHHAAKTLLKLTFLHQRRVSSSQARRRALQGERDILSLPQSLARVTWTAAMSLGLPSALLLACNLTHALLSRRCSCYRTLQLSCPPAPQLWT